MIKKIFIPGKLITLICLALLPLSTQADLVGSEAGAVLSLSPNTGSVEAGDSFSIDILLNTGGENVSAVLAQVYYDSSSFRFDGVDDASSVCDYEGSPQVNTEEGLLEKIICGFYSSGINTSLGNITTLNFTAISAVSPSSDNIYFDFTTNGSHETDVVKVGDVGEKIITGSNNARYTVTGQTTEDLTAPVISSVSASSIDESSAVINWTTSEAANSQVEYGPTTSYGSQTTLDSVLETSHLVDLNGLSSGTTYYYRVISEDSSGNSAFGSIHSFTTTGESTDGGDDDEEGSDNQVCGNGACETGETCDSCSIDCGSCESIQINENDLVREVNQPKVYLIQDNLKRWITSGQAFNDLDYSWSNVKVIGADQLSAYPEGSSINKASDIEERGQADPSELQEGDLIRGPDGIKVYIINEYGYKRHIYNPDIFNLYGHLKWENIKAVNQDALNSYQTSALFTPASSDDIYYLNDTPAGALKRLLINERVFDGYNNNHNAVFNVMSEELDMYEDVQLVKASNDYKIYLINGTTKRWIVSGQAFNSNSYDQSKIITIWPHELEEFTEGDPIQ